jgi:hypothetical protein
MANTAPSLLDDRDALGRRLGRPVPDDHPL